MEKRHGKSLHSGHRDRMRDRFLTSGIDSFSSHEIIEMLLYDSIPRVNTNDTAHALINRFGSVQGVLFADYEELLSVHGIGKRSATSLKLIGEVLKYAISEEVKPPKRLCNYEEACIFLQPMFFGATEERVIVILLDNRYGVIDCITLDGGTAISSSVTIKQIIRKVINRNAASVIVAHNHPKGLAIPSGDDISFTHNLDAFLSSVGISLMDHILFGENSAASIWASNRMGTGLTGAFSNVDDAFYRKVYFANPEIKNDKK